MSKKINTGIGGLDELVGGGFPEGRVILIIGGPGTGKTILCSQFLHKGIYGSHENGVFVSLDENKDNYYSEMQHFGWDFPRAEKEGKFAFVDATRISRLAMLKERIYKEEHSLRSKQLSIDRLIEELERKVQQVEAKRVAVDTLAALMYRFPDPVERRTVVVDLVDSLKDLGTTSLVTTELQYLGLERNALEEEFLVHGVIVMQTLFSGGTPVRAMQIEKMREAKVNPSLSPYAINDNGIEVFPNVRLFEEK
ncbi:MAG: gas vesicle protein GvpD [Candidatus Bathyarchaeota archaeon]|jgi:KaiC/GvpD/RAD55 family RecA-like ATPase